RKAVTMIEGFAREMAEDDMLQAILLAQAQIVKVIDTIEQLRTAAGLGAKQMPEPGGPGELFTTLRNKYYNELRERKLTPGKIERRDRVAALTDQILGEFVVAEGEQPPKFAPAEVKLALEQLEERVVRDLLLE